MAGVLICAQRRPETIRLWREKNEVKLTEKDAKEAEMMEELKAQAKKELTDW